MIETAWVAAAVSAFSAVLAWVSARRASTLADGLDRRRHAIEAHDREVAEFRANFATLLGALGAVDKAMDLKAALFTVELVLTHPMCTPALETTVKSVANAWTHAVATRTNPKVDFDGLVTAMRTEMRAINEAAAERRRELVTDLTPKRLWPRPW